MINVKRRDFVKLTSAIPLLGAVSLSGESSSSFSAFGAADELQKVLSVWAAEMDQTPAQYLETRDIELSNTSEVKRHSMANFEAGDVLAINGLVLSQTEAAVLAVFALTTLT